MFEERNEEKKEKALYYWSVLRVAVLSGSEYLRQGDDNIQLKKYKRKYNLKLKHGVKIVFDVQIKCFEGASIKQVIQNRQANCHIILFDDGNICLLHDDQKQDFFQCKEEVLFIAFAEKFNNYVTVCHDNHLRIFDNRLSLVNSIPFSGIVTGIVYNSFLSEIVTYGKGCFTIWSFRTAGTVLIPRKIVSENLTSWSYISCFCIEETASQNQKCFAAVRNTLFIYLLKLGDCVEVLKDMHDTDVSQILHFKPLELLATAAKDGAIKLWNKTWSLVTTFVGHSCNVSSLSVFPFGAYIMSSSLDGSIRTWSLESYDELYCEKRTSAVIGLQSQVGEEHFFSFSKDSIHKWEVNNLYEPYIMLKPKPVLIKCTSNPLVPVECICICDDHCVRVLCPVKGNIVTTFIATDGLSIMNVEYHVANKLLFVLLSDSSIVKATTILNPAKVLQIWKLKDTKAPAPICQLSLFEYIAKDIDSDDIWSNIVGKAAQQNCIDQTFTKAIVRKDSKQTTLLVGGCTNGCLVLFDWKNEMHCGKITFSLKAHHEKITAVAVNPKLSQLASASADKVVKVWRVFPFAEEALAPLLMFENPDIVHLMDFSAHVLSTIYQESRKATHTLAVYSTKHMNKARKLTHSIFDDHFDEVLSITTCSKLRLIATSSVDRTIKIWSTENKLIRILELNEIAHSIAFSSQCGDILLAIHNNVHLIKHETYLPEKYLYQMIAMEFPDMKPIPPSDVDTAIKLSLEDENKIFRATTCSMKFMKFVDCFPEDEQKERENEQSEREKSFALLAKRDKELEMIKEGKLFAKKNNAIKKVHRDEAFRKYLKLFYHRPSIPYPKDDENVNDDNADEEIFFKKIEDPYQHSRIPQGFFAMNYDKNSLEKIKEELQRKRLEGLRKRKLALEKLESNFDSSKIKVRSSSLSAMGSSTDAMITPRKPPLSASMTHRERKDATFNLPLIDTTCDFDFTSGKVETIELSAGNEFPESEKTLLEVTQKVTKKVDQHKHTLADITDHKPRLPIAPDGYLPNSVVIALYKELRRETTADDVTSWKPRGLTKEQLAEVELLKTKKETDIELDDVSSEFKLPEISDTGPNPVVEKLNQIRKTVKVTETCEDELVPNTPPITPTPKLQTPVTMSPPTKPTARVYKPAKPVTKLTAPKPVVEKEEVKKEEMIVRPPTPLPSYIQQFCNKDEGWFERLFPNPKKKMFGFGVDGFVTVLLNYIHNNGEFELKTHLIMAIKLLFDQSLLLNDILGFIESKLLTELHNSRLSATVKPSEEEINFILKLFELLLAIKPPSQLTAAELMCQYILGNFRLKSEILKIFTGLGVLDTNEYFKKELDASFDVTGMESSECKRKLYELTFNWLSKWLKLMRQHVGSLKGKICRVPGDKVVTGRKKDNQSKGILKGENVGTGMRKKQDKSIAFVSDNFVSEAAKHVTPIDAINYFCETKYQEELERVRKEQEEELRNSQEKEKKKKIKSKNAVLVLPNVHDFVSLARLGETHRSKCHPERETSLARGWNLPSFSGKGMMNNLLLQMSKLTLNPFPEELDELLYCPEHFSDLITLRSSRKYFIPSKSIVM